MKKFVCSVCGHVFEGEEAPDKCPICGAEGCKIIEQKDGEEVKSCHKSACHKDEKPSCHKEEKPSCHKEEKKCQKEDK